jgi:pimeloyl-ACP methyl ester carboxylesterase
MTDFVIPAPQFFAADGLQHAWYSWGAQTGTPVILQHGFAADTDKNWVQPGVVQSLIDTGRWVVGLDARGHGRSQPAHDSAHAGTVQMAKDVSVLIDVLQSENSVEAVDFAGYSMGGFIGMHAITTERRIRRAVIAAVGANAGGIDNLARIQSPLNLNAIADAMQAFVDDPSMSPKSIQNPDAQAFLRYARFTGADLPSLIAHMRAPVIRPTGLDSIVASVMVLAGSDDHLAKSAEVLAAAIPNAVMQRCPGDHLSAVAEPAFRSALTEFLCG